MQTQQPWDRAGRCIWMMVLCLGVFLGSSALHFALLAVAAIGIEVVLALATFVVGSIDFYRYLEELNPDASEPYGNDSARP